MPVLQRMTIKDKLIFIIMLACVTGLTLAGTAFIVWERNSSRNNLVSVLSTRAAILAENCKSSLAFQDAKDAENVLKALHVDPSLMSGTLFNDKNERFATYYRNSSVNKVTPAEFKKVAVTFNNDFLLVSSPIVLDNAIIGTICLQSDLNFLHESLKHGIQIIAIATFLSLLAVFLMSSRLQAVISKPILSLAKVAKTVSEKKDYSARALKHGSDEVGLLIDSFNEMLEQIQHRDLELVNGKEMLEERVEERTSELTSANEQLTKEIDVRKKTEGQLRRAEENYRTQFEGAMDAIFVTDAETGILTDCNPAATRLVGREKSELIGQHERILHPPKSLVGEYSKTFKEHLAEKQGETLEDEIVTKTGKVKDVAIKASLIEIRGKRFMQGNFRDITESKKAEAFKTQLLEQLASANQELKDFAYVVSHDLKAPLRGIKTIADWITTDYADKLDNDGKEQLSLLANRVDRMHNLIDGILQYSRIGRIEEEKVQLNLNKLVPEIIDMLAPPENITITIEKELPSIECEQTRITQVFQNLLSNAIKYMDKPKGQIKVGCVEENNFWKFNVTDNGPGIDEKYFEKIFKIFQTLTPRDEFESTGIGLTVIKKIVELYKGKVWLQSKVGEGTTFFFTLPKQKTGAEKNEEHLQTSAVG
jgi:two-component system, LuxR family, sensor kinase FixL